MKSDEIVEMFSQARAEMERLSVELHGGRYAPCQSEFILFGENVPSREAMHTYFGRWSEFVALCDLPLASRKYYLACGRKRQAEAIEDVRTGMREMRRAAKEAQAYEDGRGMPCQAKWKTIFNWRTRQTENVMVYELI